jgi:hypothetical protein
MLFENIDSKASLLMFLFQAKEKIQVFVFLKRDTI